MRPVVMLSCRLAGTAGEALVMAEIEIGLGAVVGDEHLAVLIRAHRARIDVEIGVELAEPDACSRAPAASAPSAADAKPLPSEETTPPVMKIYRAMGL